MDGPVTMLFDGDCGFCTTVASWWKRHLSAPDAGIAVAFQQVPDLSVYGVTASEASAALHVVTPTKVFLGGEAVLVASRSLSMPWKIVGIVASNPLGRAVANMIYPHVARNRHRLPGATASCELPIN